MTPTNLLIDKYWHTVEATLIEIFHVKPSEAYRLATSLRIKVEKRFQDELAVFYNTEEYDVAISLIGASHLDWDAHKEAYFTLKSRYSSAFDSVLDNEDSA